MELPSLNLTLSTIVFRVLALLIIAGVHGGIIAGAAVLLGDKGPRYDGRLTLSPASHLDVVGAFSFVLFGLGWAKPIDVDPREFRIGGIGAVVVVLAGFAGLVALAALLAALRVPAITALSHTAAITTAAFLGAAGSLSIWFALLSLVPVPPLTGGMLLGAVGLRLSRQVQWVFAGVLLVAVATGVARQFLGPAHAALASVLIGR